MPVHVGPGSVHILDSFPIADTFDVVGADEACEQVFVGVYGYGKWDASGTWHRISQYLNL